MLYVVLGFCFGLYVGFVFILNFIIPNDFQGTLTFKNIPTEISIFTYPVSGMILFSLGFLGASVVYAIIKHRQSKESIRKFKEATAVGKGKDEFISMALHYLRTPLSGIRWSLKSILGEVPASELQDKLNKLFAENDRALNAIEHLLKVSQVNQGRINYDLQVVKLSDLNSAIDSAVGELKDMAEAKNINIEKRFCVDSEHSVKVDVDKISAVAETMLENAIRYTPKGGEILIKTELQKNSFVFAVTDNGIQILPEDAPKIFSEFFRSENAKRFEPNGFGVGLFLAKNFIESQGGKVWFESSKAGGTTFYFSVSVLGAPTEQFLEQIN